MSQRICLMVAGVLLVLAGPTNDDARADWAAVETFDPLDLGPIDGQNGWHNPGLQADVVTSPGEGDNQSLQLVVDTGVLYKALTVPDGQARMLFLRFRFVGQHNYSLGMSHLSGPTEFSDFGPELRKSAATDNFKIHDGTNYADLTALSEATWYNLWVYIDNDPGRSQVWLHDRDLAAAVPADQLDADGQTIFEFRTDANADLINFYLKAAEGGSGQDSLWIDDIYLESGEAVNLSHPAPEPMTLGLVGLATIAWLGRAVR